MNYQTTPLIEAIIEAVQYCRSMIRLELRKARKARKKGNVDRHNASVERAIYWRKERQFLTGKR